MTRGNAVNRPDPGKAGDLAEFIGLLNELRTWAGMPSYRSLAKRVGPFMRPPRAVSASTVVDVFKAGRRRLDLGLVVAVVRALEVDEAEADRWRAACLRTHAQSSSAAPAKDDDAAPAATPFDPAPVPRLLPYSAADFTGRADELESLLALEARRGGQTAPTVIISAIDGMAGVGKTSLAVRAGHLLAERFPDGQIFLDLRGYTPGRRPTTTHTALARLLRAVGVRDEQLPHSREERELLWRSTAADLRLLIVLDNAFNAEQVRPLIPAGPGCLVLVTSRRRMSALSGATQLSLGTLAPAEAASLFADIVGHERVDGHERTVAEIVRLCGCLPLTVRIAAGRLAHRTAWSPADLLNRLRDKHRLLDELSSTDQDTAATFAVSHESLLPAHRRALQLVALHPGDDFTAEAAAALCDVSPAAAETLLDELYDLHLVQEDVAGRYRLHDLVAAFALQQQDPASAESREALGRLLDHARGTVAAAVDLLIPFEKHLRPPVPTAGRGFTDTAEAAAWLDAERSNLLAIAECAADTGFARHATDLSALLGRHLDTHGHYQDGRTLHTFAIEAAKRGGDATAERAAAAELGRASVRLGELPQARVYFERALALNPGRADVPAAARALGGLGVIDLAEGRTEEALTRYDEAATLWGTVGDTAGQATATGNVGVAYAQTGRISLAIAQHQRALVLFREVGDPSGEARTLGNLGQLYLHTRGDDSATTHLTEALRLHLAIGDLAGAGHNRAHLAQAHVGAAEFDRAAEHLEEALAFFRGSGHRQGEALVLRIRGEMLSGLGEHDRAAEQLRAALSAFEALAERVHGAHTFNSLGDNDFARGRIADALAHYRAALERAPEDGIHERADAHLGIGDALHADGHPDEARAHWRQALDVYRFMGVARADEVRRRLDGEG